MRPPLISNVSPTTGEWSLQIEQTPNAETLSHRWYRRLDCTVCSLKIVNRVNSRWSAGGRNTWWMSASGHPDRAVNRRVVFDTTRRKKVENELDVGITSKMIYQYMWRAKWWQQYWVTDRVGQITKQSTDLLFRLSNSRLHEVIKSSYKAGCP